MQLKCGENIGEFMRKAIFNSSLVVLLAACGEEVTVVPNGAACPVENEVCESELCVTQFADGVEVVNGFCTQICEWNPDQTDTCPEGQSCLQYTWTGEKYCFLVCETNADCRDDWECGWVGDSYACIPPL